MARYLATVESPRPAAEVFDYVADFTTNAEWDPGTVSADRIGGGPIGLGSECRLVVSFLRRTSRLTYRIVDTTGHAWSRFAARTRPWSHSTGSRSNRGTAAAD
jgi:hypothetical protein